MSDKEEEKTAIVGNGAPSPANKVTVAIQLGKMRDANLKYKNLLMLAKERIQQQEDELKQLRGEIVLL
jgi:hypothetical protein